MRRSIPLRKFMPLFALTLFVGALGILHRALSEFHLHDILLQKDCGRQHPFRLLAWCCGVAGVLLLGGLIPVQGGIMA